MPEGYVKQPGPFRRHSRQQRVPGGQLDEPLGDGPDDESSDDVINLNLGSATATSQTPGLITYRVIYYAADRGTWEPVASAAFTVNGCTVPPSQFICNPEDWHWLTSGAAYPSGEFMFECEGDQYQVNVSTTRGVRFNVVSGGNSHIGDVAPDCGNAFDIALSSSAARVFLNMYQTYDGTASHFGVARSFIKVKLGTNDESFYSRTADEITIGTDDIWMDFGRFTVAHEYGHAFHQETLSGNEGGNCPDPHYLDTESGLQCAFSEGFADYFGAAVRRDLSSYFYRDYMDADDGFPGCVERASEEPHTCTGGTSYEGSLIEAAYAAFLYDLTDAAVEPHDSISAPGSYMVDLIRSCQVTYGGGWRRANGTDEVAYCVENAINPGSYFARRGSYPVGYSESATEPGSWTGARANRNWTWNMYEKR